MLLHVGIDAKNLNLGQAKSLSFMKIKESIKSLSGDPGGKSPGWNALERCRKFGRTGHYSVPVAYYKSKSNTAVKGTYLNLDEKVGALGNNPELTKTIYKFNCRKPEFSRTGLCRDIAKDKKSECTKCFGTNARYMEKKVQMMYGGILSQNDEKRDGNMKITLTIKCRKRGGKKARPGSIKYSSDYAKYSFVVEDPTRRRRLLTKSRNEGDCRL